MSRRKFNREFKMTAVKLIIDDELPVKHVAEQLQVHANSLYRWVQKYETYGESAFPGNGNTIYDYQKENSGSVRSPLPLKVSQSMCPLMPMHEIIPYTMPRVYTRFVAVWIRSALAKLARRLAHSSIQRL